MTKFILSKFKLILTGFVSILTVALFKVYLGGGFYPFTFSNLGMFSLNPWVYTIV